jgi:hypothetical protein
MRKFPKEFSGLLTTRGLRLLSGNSPNGCGVFKDSSAYFANFPNLVKGELAPPLTSRIFPIWLKVNSSMTASA